METKFWAVVFRKIDGQLSPVYVDDGDVPTFAIWGDRKEAEKHVASWNLGVVSADSRYGSPYFTVPSWVLFTVEEETEEVVTHKTVLKARLKPTG